jgi:Protein of unknown function (DUF1573)
MELPRDVMARTMSPFETAVHSVGCAWGSQRQPLAKNSLIFAGVVDMSGIIKSLSVMCVLAIANGTVFGQGSWADGLFETKKIDFGVVATGSDTAQIVRIKNTTSTTVHISGTSTSCACAHAEPPAKALLKPGEETTIEVSMNTRQFKQRKDSNLLVRFDAPRFAEVRVPITAYIRTDVVFQPGRIQFGNIDFGAGAEMTVNIAYAGRTDWEIKDVKINHERLTATLKELSRTGGRVNYELKMEMDPRTRPGRVRDMITLITDDTTNPYVPLMVEGVIVPDIAVTPGNIQIRPLKPGETTTVRVVLRGKKPFIIEDIDCEGMANCFTVKLKESPNKLHIVDMEFVAPERPGKFAEQMIVKVAGREEPLRFQVSGQIN